MMFWKFVSGIGEFVDLSCAEVEHDWKTGNTMEKFSKRDWTEYAHRQTENN